MRVSPYGVTLARVRRHQVGPVFQRLSFFIFLGTMSIGECGGWLFSFGRTLSAGRILSAGYSIDQQEPELPKLWLLPKGGEDYS